MGDWGTDITDGKGNKSGETLAINVNRVTTLSPRPGGTEQ